MTEDELASSCEGLQQEVEEIALVLLRELLAGTPLRDVWGEALTLAAEPAPPRIGTDPSDSNLLGPLRSARATVGLPDADVAHHHSYRQ